ncbi:hypothetical protein [Ruminococcus sp.]|uniref:hypothetical protein n=1 Tax=Ruminococcus sp. TaxID=41978 RepID=UPI00258B37C3|nr:hypothetical protein [Ruminococcus sp.]MCR5022545.1 hypothetical protein [Ruminococcus sp.]
MTKKEIDIIISNDDIWDMFHYVYCLRRAPEQFNNVVSVTSEINQVKSCIVDEVKKSKYHFE